MSSVLVKTAVRTLFVLTSRKSATVQAIRMCADYLKLTEGSNPADGMRSVRVPPMRGVDEDMRDWSYYMILEHNRIVNLSISATVQQLTRGERLSGAALIDPKRDVMPSPSAGQEQVKLFQDSVDAHLEMVKTLGRLRGTHTSRHPIFGEFDAHKWHCMFAFHLRIHLAQAEKVLQTLQAQH